jgi:hypothetical protein
VYMFMSDSCLHEIFNDMLRVYLTRFSFVYFLRVIKIHS